MENFCPVVFQQIFEKWEIKSDWENEIISGKKKVFSNFFPKAAKELKTQNISNFMQNESNDSLKEALNYFEKKKKTVLKILKESFWI